MDNRKEIQPGSPYQKENFPKGDNIPLEQLYVNCREQFFGWAFKSFGMDRDGLEEIYTEAVILFRRKAWDGSLSNYRGKAVNTILFSFARNLIRNRYKKQSAFQKIHSSIDESVGEIADDAPFIREDQGIFGDLPSGKMAALLKAFTQISERCRELLTQRIVHRFSMEEIAANLGLKNADSAKTAKNKCLKRLKGLLGLK